MELLNDFLVVSQNPAFKKTKNLFSWLILPRCDKNKVAWKLGFKLWWTSPSSLVTSLAVIPVCRKWAWHLPVYIFYVCLPFKLPYQHIQSNRTFQKRCGNNPVSRFESRLYHIFSSSHIWKASKASQDMPHYHRQYESLFVASVWDLMMKKGEAFSS